MDAININDLSDAELIELCAADDELFNRHFFPKAFRSPSPSFATKVSNALNNPTKRFVQLKMFRGAAKTTRLRAFTAKRIAYSMSRTILYIGASESHATRSVQWVRGQIEERVGADGTKSASNFARTFGLRPGRKWQEHEIEVYHGVDERPIWLLGVGITGTIRGINFDDYRPDLIICDDIITDENAQTAESREKIIDLVLGAVKNSLSREDVNAKLVLLNTPIAGGDISEETENDPEWHTESIGCWTEATSALRVDQQVSAWEEMFPTEDLRKQKLSAVARNRYSIFAREMEVALIGVETAAFLPQWLKHYTEVPKGLTCVIAIDPVPPPSDKAVKKKLKGLDLEAIIVMGRAGGNYYVLDYATSKGHDPSWTTATVIQFALTWRPLCVVVESVAYQRVLKWLLSQAFARIRRFWPLVEVDDRRPKYTRITSAFNEVASLGLLFCRPEHTEFILAWQTYGLGFRGSDDLLDAGASAQAKLANPYLEGEDDPFSGDDNIVPFKMVRGAP